MDSHTQHHMQKAANKMMQAHTGVFLALGALAVAAVNTTKAMQHLQEVLRREKAIQEAAESNGEVDEPAQKMAEIIEDYNEGVN